MRGGWRILSGAPCEEGLTSGPSLMPSREDGVGCSDSEAGPSPSAAGEAQPILTLRGGLSALLNCRDHASLCNPRQPHLHVLGLKKRL